MDRSIKQLYLAYIHYDYDSNNIIEAIQLLNGIFGDAKNMDKSLLFINEYRTKK